MGKNYSLGEELANSISHGIGALFSAVGIGVLSTQAVIYGTTTTIVSSIIYGITLFLMYISSTLYHAFRGEKIKKLFKKFDHCSIFLLIAGSYTPFTLITLKGKVGYTLFAVIWTLAIFGILLKTLAINKTEKLSLICYLAMGWLVVFSIEPLMDNLATNGIILLLLGGISYTVGVIFYLAKKTPYMHMVWHLFVLSGSIFHFVSISMYVI